MRKSVLFALAAFFTMAAFFPQGVNAQNTESTELTNLVIFMRFADDEEIDYNFDSIDRMFNSREPGYLSVYNYFDAISYGRIHYNTVYTNNIQNGIIVSYVDTLRRGCFEPYSDSNTIGFQFEIPMMGVCMLEAQLLARIFDYVDSLHLVDDSVVLDGNGDGEIDNISIVVKGGIGDWSSLLWPHMEFFPQDSIDHPVLINGKRPSTFNFEFEGAPTNYFDVHTFRHEMGHSLMLPDHYHYLNYFDVEPVGLWDQMNRAMPGGNDVSAIYKSKVLHVADEPIRITTDGDYTLNSLGTGPSQNCYYIKSSIDSTQWYTFEYRRQDDLFEAGLSGTGLIIGRWNDTITLDNVGMYATSYFDFFTQTHQYWFFRPGSDIDTVAGDIDQAHFSLASGRTSFGPTTDPHPYLTDGTRSRASKSPISARTVPSLHSMSISSTSRASMMWPTLRLSASAPPTVVWWWMVPTAKS